MIATPPYFNTKSYLRVPAVSEGQFTWPSAFTLSTEKPKPSQRLVYLKQLTIYQEALRGSL